MKKLIEPYLGLPKEVYVIFISRIINAVGCFVFPLLTLILTKKLGMSSLQTGLWVSTCGLISIPSSLIGGKLVDSIGRKKIIIIFDTLGALCYIIIGIVGVNIHIIYLLLLASFLYGLADPAHGAIIADVTTPENRNGAYSLSYMGFNLGFVIGPIIGGFLFENHLNLLFIGDAVTTLCSITLVSVFIKETIEKTKEDLGEERELEKSVEGSIFKVLLDRPILIYFALIMFGYNFVYSQWGFMLPMYTEESFVNQGAKIYGSLASLNGFIVITCTPLITSLLSKIKNIKRVFLGGIMYTIGFGMFAFYSTKIVFFIAVLIFTLGEVIVTISATPFIVNQTPASHRGRMNSVLPIIMGLGFTLGPVVMGKVLTFVSLKIAWKIIGIIMLISSMFMLTLSNLNKSKKMRG